MALPMGFRFCPSDQELITYYLKPKILGQNLACDLFNSTPWELFDVNDANLWTGSHLTSERSTYMCLLLYPRYVHLTLSEKYLYVFTTLSKIRSSENRKQKRIRENTCKKAGCGTWDAKTKRKPITDCQGNVIGEQRMLLFKIDDTGDQFYVSKAGHFRMHEYSLAGINKGLKSVAGGGDVVLCKITFDFSKDPVFSLGSKTTDREGAENLTSTSVVEMKSGVADNTESTEYLTSEHVFVKDSGLADLVADLFNDDSHEFNDYGWDSSFTDTFMAMLNSNPEEGAVEDISKLGKRKFEEENMHGSKKICL